MGTIVIRAILIYILILFVFRLMGKRQIGQMQPFELVLTLIIADLATIPVAEIAIPFLHGVVPLLTLLVVHYFLTIVCQKSVKLDKIINGKPIIVLTPEGIDYKAIKSLNISIEDIIEGIRGKGFFSLEDVAYVIVETTGQINAMAKASNAPATKSDLNIAHDLSSLPITLVSEGAIMKDNLDIAGVDESFVQDMLKKAKIKKMKDCIICTLDKNGKIYIQAKNQHYQLFQTKQGGGIKI